MRFFVVAMGIGLSPLAGMAGGLGDVNGDGCVDLRDYAQLQRDFEGPGCEVPPVVVVTVPVMLPGPGPEYGFEISKYEITNEQFATFLNDAQLDGGVTRRGSFMVFAADGTVTTLAGDRMARPQGVAGAAGIIYDNSGPLGERYRPAEGLEAHPVVEVSWLGAVKFCNWLTITYGIGVQGLCYSEGPGEQDWHPIVVDRSTWNSRDLDDVERGLLIDACRGFRLPMDNLGFLTGFLSNQENSYNEWYKTVARDKSAPDFARLGLEGETVSAGHWMFGFGADSISPGDANYRGSLDPFDDGTTPVGYFNGLNWLAGNVGRTNDTRNAFGCYDLAGNVSEWVQDHAGSVQGRAVRGGSWASKPTGLSASYRGWFRADNSAGTLGFRVVRVP